MIGFTFSVVWNEPDPRTGTLVEYATRHDHPSREEAEAGHLWARAHLSALVPASAYWPPPPAETAGRPTIDPRGPHVTEIRRIGERDLG